MCAYTVAQGKGEEGDTNVVSERTCMLPITMEHLLLICWLSFSSWLHNRSNSAFFTPDVATSFFLSTFSFKHLQEKANLSSEGIRIQSSVTQADHDRKSWCCPESLSSNPRVLSAEWLALWVCAGHFQFVPLSVSTGCACLTGKLGWLHDPDNTRIYDKKQKIPCSVGIAEGKKTSKL